MFKYDVAITDTQNYVISATAQDANAVVKIYYPNAIPGKAIIKVIAENGVNNFFYSLSITHLVGIDKAIDAELLFTVFPNPNRGNFNIQSELSGTVFIYNQMGSLMKHVELFSNNVPVNITGLSAGVYFFRFYASNKTMCKKLIIAN